MESNGQLGVVGTLGVIFVVLKLVGLIDWSWLWVLAPFWIGLALWAITWGAIGIVLLVRYLGDFVSGRRP